MPNQNNFRSDVTTKTEPTYLASRIVRVPSEPIFFEEVPGSFAYDKEDYIEVHFYTIPNNERIISTTIKLNDTLIGSHLVAHTDGTYKNYIRIDFTKLFVDKSLILIPGDYRVVLNFFSDEIGSYDDRKLRVVNISETRTEVELAFPSTTDEVILFENQELLSEFVEKSFARPDAVGAAEKIFTFGVIQNDVNEGVNSTNIIDNIDIPLEGQTFDNTIARIERLGLRQIFEEQLNDFVKTLYPKLREQIVINGDERIQEPEFQQFIADVATQHIVNLRQTVDGRIKIK